MKLRAFVFTWVLFIPYVAAAQEQFRSSLQSDISLTTNGTQTVFTRTVTMPSTGGPFTIRVYYFFLTLLTGLGPLSPASFDVAFEASDGVNPFADADDNLTS